MNKLSRCCAAPVEAIHEDEGQSYWVCTSCHNQCGVTEKLYEKKHSTNTSKKINKDIEGLVRANVMLVSGKDIFKEKGSNKIETTGINWLFKKKKIKENKKCLDCDNQAKSNVAKYCLDCSHKRAVANNSKQSLRRYHRNKNEIR